MGSLKDPTGSHFDLFQTYISLAILFLFQNHAIPMAFFEPRNFLMWRMDGMDGMVGKLFLGLYLVNY